MTKSEKLLRLEMLRELANFEARLVALERKVWGLGEDVDVSRGTGESIYLGKD